MDNKEIINKFLVGMLDLMKTAKDFTMEQAPEVAKEIVRYTVVVDTFYVLLGLAFLGIAVFCIKAAMARIPKYGYIKDGDELIVACIGILGTVLFLLVSLSMVVVHISELLKIYFAPRLFLIEYLAHLVKTGVGS